MTAYQPHEIKCPERKQSHGNVREPKRRIGQLQECSNHNARERCNHNGEDVERKCNGLKQENPRNLVVFSVGSKKLIFGE